MGEKVWKGVGRSLLIRPPAPELALWGSSSFCLSLVGGRKAAVSFHTALSSGKRADSVEAKPLSGASISPRMLQPLLTGHRSQDCGASGLLPLIREIILPPTGKPKGACFWDLGYRINLSK